MHVVSPPPRMPHSPPLQMPRPQRLPGTTLLLALAAGLAAAALTFLLVRGRLAAQAATPASAQVVVAARDIPVRTRLTAGWLATRRVPPADVPEGAASTLADVVGKVTLQAIAKGAALTRSAVTAPDVALGMAFALPPNLRAVTVVLDPSDGPDEFVRPGDHVDLLATDEPGSGPAEVRTVLQNVRLLAVGAQTAPDAAPPAESAAGAARVTVAVSPRGAQALVLAGARGKLHLALRAADDEAVSPVPVFPAPPVRREQAEAPPAPPPPRHRVPRAVPAVTKGPSPKILPLPPLPVAALRPPPARVTVTVIKGSQSQTVSVVP